MTSKTRRILENEIEELVRQHIAAQRDEAIAALERAFAASTKAPPPRASRSRQMAAPRRTRRVGKRRPSMDVAALSEQLFEAVCAHPGEKMSLIAAELGRTARELNRPMLNLKSAGRIRSAGQRQNTRYFPMTSSKRASPTA